MSHFSAVPLIMPPLICYWLAYMLLQAFRILVGVVAIIFVDVDPFVAAIIAPSVSTTCDAEMGAGWDFLPAAARDDFGCFAKHSFKSPEDEQQRSSEQKEKKKTRIHKNETTKTGNHYSNSRVHQRNRMCHEQHLMVCGTYQFFLFTVPLEVLSQVIVSREFLTAFGAFEPLFARVE